MNPSRFFFDALLRAPTIASMLMCLAASLVGVLVVLRKRSLIGETLSHASYPGVVISVILASVFFGYSDEVISIAILIGAFVFSVLGLFTVEFMERKVRVKSDAALCFVLSTFLGIGILIASRIQITHAVWYRQIQAFLYGQAATMTDIHVKIYSLLVLLTVVFFITLYPQIKLLTFDRLFATTIGMNGKTVDTCSFILLVLAIVIGIRSVGVVMMSGMLIAPAVAARQYSDKLSTILVLSAIFGLISGFFGVYFSVVLPLWFADLGKSIYLPTGPMIILIASAICFFSLFFAPKRGVFFRGLRILGFNYQCAMENALKSMWKSGGEKVIAFSEFKVHALKFPTLILMQLYRKNLIRRVGRGLQLTFEGQRYAKRIVRLHRLWEVYLFSKLEMQVEKIHASAEEMEHILNGDMEKKLTALLNDPKEDPHQQPIPTSRGSHESI